MIQTLCSNGVHLTQSIIQALQQVAVAQVNLLTGLTGGIHAASVPIWPPHLIRIKIKVETE